MPLLQIHTASTRPARQGPLVASWFTDIARQHGGFTLEPIDLATVGLPLLDEPQHPSLGRYMHEHTRQWAATVARADAHVFVTPEYDFLPPASLVNALQCLVREWAYRPVGLVSYGGVSGGLRGAQVLKQLVTALRMMPVPEAVAIPFFGQYRHDGDPTRFDPGDVQGKAAHAILTELARWTEALDALRRASRDAAPA